MAHTDYRLIEPTDNVRVVEFHAADPAGSFKGAADHLAQHPNSAVVGVSVAYDDGVYLLQLCIVVEDEATE